MLRYPNKGIYKWLEKYDLLTAEASRILMFRQDEGAVLDICQKVVQYSKIFDDIHDINEFQAGNGHPKSKTLYKRVFNKIWQVHPSLVL